MLRKGLRNNKQHFDEEDLNPMEGAINIVDAMLVFACGLMLSLVIHWNVDFKDAAQVVQGEEMTQVESLRDEIEKNSGQDGEYQYAGKVYVDPNTGEMYLIEEDTDE
jgi:hypothetical protein